MIYWDSEIVTGLCGLVWCITTPVSPLVGRKTCKGRQLIANPVEEVEKYVKVLDEVLSEQMNGT